MNEIISALAPVLGLIILGYGLRRRQFLTDNAWRGIERLTYFILFPILLVHTLGQQSLAGSPWPAMLGVVVGIVLSAAAVLVVWHRRSRAVSGPTFTSVFQGGVRFNTYIALALAQSFFGPAGLAMAAVAAGFMIVLINLLCVSALAIWGDRPARGPATILGDIVGNPLIVGCVIGWFLSLSGLGLPGVAADVLEVPGRAALPLGLLAVGAALRPEALRGHSNHILVATVVQFGLKPLAAGLLVPLFGLSGVPAGALYIAFMSPTAPSAYILAAQLGGDSETMASIITAQTIFAFIAMPVLAAILLV